MTLQQITDMVAEIEKYDPESAHCVEDKLHIDFICYVAEHGPKKLKLLAREVLKARDIQFKRWCA